MHTNIIRAIINLVNNPITKITEYYNSKNRANSMGEALEEYVKDLYAGTVEETDERIRNRKISECFSYLGNQNNPPDSIIRGGDAIEVKKIESKGSSLALNSSYPKAKIFANSTMITDACRNCEEWVEKDIIYTIGVVKNNILSNLCMVYGADYAASTETYERIRKVIKNGVYSIEDVGFSETKELGRVNQVDPLSITYLRIRGMWVIQNPMKVFSYIYQRDESKNFNFMALINQGKYDTLKYTKELEELATKVKGLNIEDVEIKKPDNPAQLKKAKLITFTK